jgi:hypothetical protein
MDRGARATDSGKAVSDPRRPSLSQPDSGTSQRAARAVILSGAPSLEAGEITDNGYVNQCAVLTWRADDVQRLFSDADSVIVIE